MILGFKNAYCLDEEPEDDVFLQMICTLDGDRTPSKSMLDDDIRRYKAEELQKAYRTIIQWMRILGFVTGATVACDSTKMRVDGLTYEGAEEVFDYQNKENVRGYKLFVINDGGIIVGSSNNNSIYNNICSSNKQYAGNHGIYLGGSNNTVSNNICTLNAGDGIIIFGSNNTISNNNCSYNNYGIDIGGSGEKAINNSISNNICHSNKYNGIYLGYSSNNNKLTGNIMVENGIYIDFRVGPYYPYYLFTQEIDKSNTVNGKPVYYWEDAHGGRIPEGAGQVILVNCTNVIVENQELNEASVGIEVAFSSFITIKNNNCTSNNEHGIYLSYSNNSSYQKPM